MIMSDKELLAKYGFEETTIPEQKLYDGLPFPLVVKPAVEKNVEEWCKTVQENQKDLEQLVHKYGSILFVDFPIETPANFDKFTGKDDFLAEIYPKQIKYRTQQYKYIVFFILASFGWGHFPYLGGPAPRKNIKGNVYTSNEVKEI